MNTNLVVRYILREISGIAGMGVVLFWAAGDIGWWPAWAALAVMLGWLVATDIIIFRFCPDLLMERLVPRKGARRRDEVIVSTLALVQLIRYIVAGLDYRYGWTGGFPLGVQIAALAACAAGYAVFVWAMASNAFFSQIARIQRERGHVVATGGPYAFVRHPAYAGAILYELAVSILLASWWALVISGLNAILLIIRTAFEDSMLMDELAGYVGYARRVRYRLLPGIW